MLQAPWERSVRDLEEAEPPIVAGKSKSSYDQTVPKESFLTIAILEPMIKSSAIRLRQTSPLEN